METRSTRSRRGLGVDASMTNNIERHRSLLPQDSGNRPVAEPLRELPQGLLSLGSIGDAGPGRQNIVKCLPRLDDEGELDKESWSGKIRLQADVIAV